jgi:hypothetical protein
VHLTVARMTRIIIKSSRPYLGLQRHQTFCDDEHSVVARAKLQRIQQALSLQNFSTQFCPRCFALKLLGRKGPRLRRGMPARPANFYPKLHHSLILMAHEIHRAQAFTDFFRFHQQRV